AGFLSVCAGTAAALAIGLVMAHPLLHAQFGPIDDHETLSWLGRDNSLGLRAIWPTFAHDTEVGQWGASHRFRPAYYAARVVETAVLTDHPLAWYATVLTAFAITCGLLGYAVALWLIRATGLDASNRATAVSVLTSAVAAVALTSMRAWAGIMTR